MSHTRDAETALKGTSMNQHNVLLICLLTGYAAVNVITALRSRVFLLAQSRARLALYGIAFLLWGSLIVVGIEFMELVRRLDDEGT
jgi:hypothetical protein